MHSNYCEARRIQLKAAAHSRSGYVLMPFVSRCHVKKLVATKASEQKARYGCRSVRTPDRIQIHKSPSPASGMYVSCAGRQGFRVWIEYDTIRCIYVCSKAEELASLV